MGGPNPEVDSGNEPTADQEGKLVEFAFGRTGLGSYNRRSNDHTDEREADQEFVHLKVSYVDVYRPNPLVDHDSRHRFAESHELPCQIGTVLPKLPPWC